MESVAREMVTRLRSHGHIAYFAGGCVRDLLRGETPKDIDIASIDAVLTRNGEVVAKGRSDAVLGNPVTAVAWLARKVDSFGVRLKAGDIVLPGSCTKAFDATP